MGERKRPKHHQMTTDPDGYAKKWHDYFHKKEHRVGKYYMVSDSPAIACVCGGCCIAQDQYICPRCGKQTPHYPA